MITTIAFGNNAVYTLPYEIGISVGEMLDEDNRLYRISIGAKDREDLRIHRELFQGIEEKLNKSCDTWLDDLVITVGDVSLKMTTVFVSRQSKPRGFEFECSLKDIKYSTAMSTVIKQSNKTKEPKIESKVVKSRRKSTNKG